MGTSVSKSAQNLSHVLPLHPAEDWSELWEKKGSLVQKRQHKHGRGGNYIGAKLVVCLGEEITSTFRNKEIPCIKVSWKCFNRVDIKKEEEM